MRRVEEILSNEVESRSADEEQSIAPAAGALKSKRLTFAWLDGEAQKVNICVFVFLSVISSCMHSETISIPQSTLYVTM